jgi:DNA-binding response OmpR family regulator
LEKAGYRVILATHFDEIASRCKEHKVDLVLLGSSLSPAEKRRFWVESRDTCRTPILELYSFGPPELMDESRTYSQQSRKVDDFLGTVQTILERQ